MGAGRRGNFGNTWGSRDHIKLSSEVAQYSYVYDTIKSRVTDTDDHNNLLYADNLISAYQAFVSMVCVLGFIYNEVSNVELEDYLNKLANPNEYEEFKKDYIKWFPLDLAPVREAYDFCRQYLYETAPQVAIEAFSRIIFEKWVKMTVK